MFIEGIRKEGKDILIIDLKDIYKMEFASDFAAKDNRYMEEFSVELINTIRQKYPKFKKGSIKVVCGSVVIATMYINGAQLTVNSVNTTTITIPVKNEKRFSMSYLYFGSYGSHISKLSNTNNSLDMVSPSYFDLDENGNLKITSLYNQTFVDTAHGMNISVIPFLSNHWDRDKGINALKNKEKLSDDIALAVKEFGLDGVQVDIENVTHTEKDMYTDFVRLLREKIPAGKEVSVAVAANPYEWEIGWQGSYDYTMLAKYSDYLMIMTYDEHYQGGEEGPVASLEFVEKSIQYALKHTSADKIVVGLPFFARYWQDGASYGGYGMSLSKVYELIENYESTVTYDYHTRSAKAVVTINAEDPKPVVNYKTLSAGTYNIWFEDDTSLREKLMLVDKYKIKGSGSWSLGQEDDDIWSYYTKWLNGSYYNDIALNWARDDIMDAVTRGDMRGVSSVSFEPNRNITRAEFVTLLLRKFNIQTKKDIASRFDDTAAHWASKEISTAAEEGIVFGAQDGKFYPDRAVTRGEAASILARIMQLDTKAQTDIKFWDVKDDSLIKSEINAVVSAGIFKGYKDGSFKPQQGLTRAETAVLTGRIID